MDSIQARQVQDDLIVEWRRCTRQARVATLRNNCDPGGKRTLLDLMLCAALRSALRMPGVCRSYLLREQWRSTRLTSCALPGLSTTLDLPSTRPVQSVLCERKVAGSVTTASSSSSKSRNA